MYKISHEVINFIDKTMKTCRVELTAGGRSLAEANFQRGIFQGDALSPSLFIIAMMPLNHVPRKCTAGYKNQSPNIHGWHQTICKKWKRTGNSNTQVWIYSHEIGMEFVIEKCTMLVMKSGKRHLTDEMELPNQDKTTTLAENVT